MAKPTHSRVVARAEHRAHTKDFLKLAQDICTREGWREDEALSHWLTVACCALRRPLLAFAPTTLATNEARYMAVVERCRHPHETMRHLGQALGVIIEALEAEMADVLTPIFSEVSASSQLGQFFTPWSLSLTSARMLLQDAPAMLAEAEAHGRRYLLCGEPACGVGGMALAANMVFREHGICPARQVHWIATDVDWRAVCGAYIQLTLTGASAEVVHGNTLTLEVHERMPTFAAMMHPKRQAAEVAEPEPEPEPDVVFDGSQGAFDFMRDVAA